jgi:hypothetical protein
MLIATIKCLLKVWLGIEIDGQIFQQNFDSINVAFLI